MPKAKLTKSAISTFQFQERFPDAEAARLYLEGRLWPSGARCPVCGLGERTAVAARRLCAWCGQELAPGTDPPTHGICGGCARQVGDEDRRNTGEAGDHSRFNLIVD